MTQAWIALQLVRGLGPVGIQKFVDHFGSAEAVFAQSQNELNAIHGITNEVRSQIISHDALFRAADEQCLRAERAGVTIITIASKEYPPYLREIFGPPPVLFVKGDRSVFEGHSVGIVGTRNPTTYGKQVTLKLTSELVEQGLVIASGLALGIDTIAHQTAIDNGGKTIAVLGSGIDRLYPKSNSDLAERVCDHGALVSEFLMGTTPESYNFPRRNRIISGLSAGVVVIEGTEKSGSLITAHYALQQGRDVFAVPGSITSPLSSGTFRLIRDGAIPARSGKEIAESLSLITNPLLHQMTKPAAPTAIPLEMLSENERQVYEHLSSVPTRIDEISEGTKLDTVELYTILLNLELKGAIEQVNGGCYCRS